MYAMIKYLHEKYSWNTNKNYSVIEHANTQNSVPVQVFSRRSGFLSQFKNMQFG